MSEIKQKCCLEPSFFAFYQIFEFAITLFFENIWTCLKALQICGGLCQKNHARHPSKLNNHTLRSMLFFESLTAVQSSVIY